MPATLACATSFSQTDFRVNVGAITVPTLVIHGDADQTVPIDASARVVQKLLPNALYKEYAGAPHGLFITEKDKLTHDLLELSAR